MEALNSTQSTNGGISPVVSLSDDILSSVFILASLPEPKWRDFDDFNMVPAVEGGGGDNEVHSAEEEWYRDENNVRVAISHVCRRWRLVALESALLWTRLSFASAYSHAMFMEFFARSKGSPLSITITTDEGEGLDQVVNNIIDEVVVPNFYRVKKLLVNVGLSEPSTLWLQRIIDKILILPAPMLEDFIIGNPERPWSDIEYEGNVDIPSGVPPFQNAFPRLKTMELLNILLRWESNDDIAYHMLFANLVKLKVRRGFLFPGPTMEQFTQLVTTSPHLGELYLETTGPLGGHFPQSASSAASTNAPKMYLPSLHKLSIEYKPVSYLTAVFRVLRMPKLQRLRLELIPTFENEDEDEKECDIFVQELMESSTSRHPQCILSNVETLDVAGVLPCNPALVPKLYAAMPNLRSLRLNMLLLGPYFFTTLYTNPTTTPNLKTVSCAGVGHDVANLVRERERAGFGLQRVLVDRSDKTDPLDEDFVRNSVEFGFHHVRYR